MAEQSPERKRSGLKQFQTRSFSGHRSVIYSRVRFLNTAARKGGNSVPCFRRNSNESFLRRYCHGENGQSHQMAIEFLKRSVSSDGPAGMGDSFVTRC